MQHYDKLAVKSTAVKSEAVKPAAVKSAAVKPAFAIKPTNGKLSDAEIYIDLTIENEDEDEEIEF